jgi:hypothetical protein
MDRATPERASTVSERVGGSAAGAVTTEAACELLIDAAEVGPSWTRQDVPQAQSNPDEGVAGCHALYALFGAIRNPPSAGPVALTSTVFMADTPLSLDRVIDLARLRPGEGEVTGTTYVRTLDLIDGPQVGEGSQWYRQTITWSVDDHVYRELGVLLDRGRVYARVSGFGLTELEPLHLLGAAQAASDRIGRLVGGPP